MNKTRKIIQIAAAPETKYSLAYTIVLCDDGTVWSMRRMDGNDVHSEWLMCPPVPQEEIEHES